MRERGEHHHGSDVLVADDAGGGDAVHTGHLHVHAHDIRAELARQIDGLLTIGRLADDLIPVILQHGHQIHAVHRLVLGDNDRALLVHGALDGLAFGDCLQLVGGKHLLYLTLLLLR